MSDNTVPVGQMVRVTEGDFEDRIGYLEDTSEIGQGIVYFGGPMDEPSADIDMDCLAPASMEDMRERCKTLNENLVHIQNGGETFDDEDDIALDGLEYGALCRRIARTEAAAHHTKTA